jgi:methylmalonyl-CoA/ethylmalonyl-CoA epimerase
MIAGLSHVAVAVPDIAKASALLREKFGISVGAVAENAVQKVRLAYADLGSARLELIEPSTDDSPLWSFLERNPKGGLHHVAFLVTSLERSLEELTQTGTRIIGTPGRSVHGDPIAFLHPADILGTLVELEERQVPEASARSNPTRHAD